MVEDDTVDQKLAVHTLETLGYRVDEPVRRDLLADLLARWTVTDTACNLAGFGIAL